MHSIELSESNTIIGINYYMNKFKHIFVNLHNICLIIYYILYLFIYISIMHVT